MPPTIPPDLAIALYFLRMGQGWSQAKLGAAAGVSANLINDYERGRKPLDRARLEFLITPMNIPAERLDETLACMSGNRTASEPHREAGGQPSATRRRIEAVAARAGRLASEFARSTLLVLAREAEALHARQKAEALWVQLARHPHEERIALVEESQRFRSWALVERVAAESIERAPESPQQAFDLSTLGFRIAELTPGSQGGGLRLQGYALAHVANARRVLNDLPGADADFERAMPWWEAGAEDDPGLLNGVWVYWIEATLRKGQRRCAEAQAALERALGCDAGDLRPRLLLTKAQIETAAGEYEASIETLGEALSLVYEASDPRTAFALRFQIIVNLCLLGRPGEAALQLVGVREIARASGRELDAVRLTWLEGVVASGLGQNEEAEQRFEAVRREFLSRQFAFDYALVSLELSLVLLRMNRKRELRSLAEGMVWIFRSQGVPREALAALSLFCEAAQQETLTVEVARKVARYLYRAKHDAGLPFEA